MKKTGNLPRVMIAAAGSGSGKTTITCGLLQILKNRGIRVQAFKCGPDYIDPLFHTRVIGVPSRNLDLFLSPEDTVRYLLTADAEQTDLAVIEGVMGFYDGLGGIRTSAGSYDLAKCTGTPVILILDCKGMSLSAAAMVKGFAGFRSDSHIEGVILNRMSPGLYPALKEEIEKETGIPVVGYVPKLTDCLIESRHLGLVLPCEIEDLKRKLEKLVGIIRDTIEIDRILAIAGKAADQETEAEDPAGFFRTDKKVRIGLARDEAFCFVYEDNLRLLRRMGAEIVPFSILRDRHLPEDLQGLLLYGGYPELYAEQIAANRSMLEEIREHIENGIPCMAECGGFMILHEIMEDMDGKEFSMAGVIPGRVFYAGKLTRFGYVTLTPDHESGLPEGIRADGITAHEFHYYDSTAPGEACTAVKPVSGRSWKCMHIEKNLLAGFPHLYYYGAPGVAADFLDKAQKIQRVDD